MEEWGQEKMMGKDKKYRGMKIVHKQTRKKQQNQSKLPSSFILPSSQKPSNTTNIQRKRHITIVILMILGIVVVLLIAYLEGMFGRGV
jgi:hypothetical protein